MNSIKILLSSSRNVKTLQLKNAYNVASPKRFLNSNESLGPHRSTTFNHIYAQTSLTQSNATTQKTKELNELLLKSLRNSANRVQSNPKILANDYDEDDEDKKLAKYKKENIENSNDPFKKPSRETLVLTKEKLVYHLLNFLHDKHPNDMYTQDVIFENFYTNPQTITVGLMKYIAQLKVVKFKIKLFNAYSKVDILKATIDENDSSIKIRWRLRSVRRAMSYYQLFKARSWSLKYLLKINENWNDGFSVFYLRNDGLIYKHTVQKVVPKNDEEYDIVKNPYKNLQNLDVAPTMYSKYR